MSTLIKILEQSVAKNGPDHVLTLGHLLNILKLEQRKKEQEEELLDFLEIESDFDSRNYGDSWNINQKSEKDVRIVKIFGKTKIVEMDNPVLNVKVKGHS